MKTFICLLAAAAALAGCRETGVATQSAPSAGTLARVMRFDTTFVRQAQRNRAFRYAARLRVGRGTDTTSIPVEINWTAVPNHGCPQIASVQVYQLNGDDPRYTLQASVRRDSTCHATPGPDGKLGTATAGLAQVSVGGAAKGVRYATVSTCQLNALGYHDELTQ